MRKLTLWFISISILFALPATSYAIGVEIAGGAWYQSPSGDLSFDEQSTSDDFDLEDDLKYDDKWKPIGRLKIETPALFPNFYLMATPLKWDETGQKGVDFELDGENFDANVDFDSELKLNHLDAAIYWSIPLVETASLKTLNLDLGLNVRLLDLDAEIEQEDTGAKLNESYLLPIPMLYAGMQIRPIDLIAFEFEGRGIGYTSGHYISLIGRCKIKPFGPLFAAGGYRYDNINIDYQDVDIDATFEGPFAEIGLEF